MLQEIINQINQYDDYISLKQYTEDKTEFNHFKMTQQKIKIATKYRVVDPDSTRRSRRQNNQLKFTIPVVNAGATSTILEDILTGLFSLIECIECYLSESQKKRYIHFTLSDNQQQGDNNISINIKNSFYKNLFDYDEIDKETSRKVCSQNYFPIPKNNSIIHEYQFNQQDKNREIYINQFIQLHGLWKKYRNLLDVIEQLMSASSSSSIIQEKSSIITFDEEDHNRSYIFNKVKEQIKQIRFPTNNSENTPL